MSLLIGFGYKARSGKDTAVQAIIDARSSQYDVRRYAFADELKREYTEACKQAGSAFELINQMRVTHNLPDWVQYEFGSDMTDPLCPFGKQRALLQWWGTEYRRAQDPFYWVKLLHKRLLEERPAVALISDLRFPNEALYIKANKGYTVEVQREGYEDFAASQHPSEHLLSMYTFDIRIKANDGDVEQLKTDAIAVFDLVVEWNTPRDIEAEVNQETEQNEIRKDL